MGRHFSTAVSIWPFLWASILKEKGLNENRISEVGNRLMLEFVSPAALRYWGYGHCMAGIALVRRHPPAYCTNYGYEMVIVATIIQACVNFHHFVTDAAVWRFTRSRLAQSA